MLHYVPSTASTKSQHEVRVHVQEHTNCISKGWSSTAEGKACAALVSITTQTRCEQNQTITYTLAGFLSPRRYVFNEGIFVTLHCCQNRRRDSTQSVLSEIQFGYSICQSS